MRIQSSDPTQEIYSSKLKMYEFTKWHRARRGKVKTGLPVICCGWGTLQVSRENREKYGMDGIDFVKQTIDQMGRVPEVVGIDVYGGTYGKPSTTPGPHYINDMKIIDYLLKVGVKKVMPGTSHDEFRMNHFPGTGPFVRKSIKFLEKLYKLWGKNLMLAYIHPDAYRDATETGGEIASWIIEHDIPAIIMCGYTWLFDNDHPMNNGVWTSRDGNHPQELMSQYVSTFGFGTGLGGIKGLEYGSLGLAEDFGYKFATLSLS